MLPGEVERRNVGKMYIPIFKPSQLRIHEWCGADLFRRYLKEIVNILVGELKWAALIDRENQFF